ncbi:hypothetical protein [Cryptosporangium phraense]|uniref:Uncharacterized protein n=1 Tax=Cryptosporangium phraense TaxID=2593070 RepID=A0A545AES4_9ACTN|nr:hypothetical protein [Cryptosporangium phraense]TQS39813.1 hypothetical protein FL583_37960 [Cryptosporangium phraense]
MAAPPRSPDGPLDVRGEEPDWSVYDEPGTRFGRSATVYGRTVTDYEPDEDLLGFVGVADLPAGRHSASEGRLSGTLAAAGLPVVALGIAVVALLIAGIATVTGIIAVGRATSAEGAAKRAAVAAASDEHAVDPEASAQAAAPAPVPSSAPPSPSPSPSPTDPDRLDPGANYELAYADQLVRVQPSTCEGTDLDLDQPRVLPVSGADASYRSCADGLHLDFDQASRFAVIDNRDPSARDCVNAVRADPGVGWVAPSPGTTVCVLTSRLAAESQQLTTKLVRMNVESVEADGSLAAELTAWVVP